MICRKIILCIGSLFLLLPLAGQVEDRDSLLAILNHMPADTTRLVFLSDLTKKNLKNKDVFWKYQLLSEALKQKDTRSESQAYFWLLEHYYSYDMDSFKFYMNRAEPVFMKNGMYENLFRVKAWYGYLLTSSGMNDEALKWIRDSEAQAIQLEYPDGRNMIQQALANFYMKNKLNKEGEDLYNEILRDMEERNVPLVKRLYIIRQLFMVVKDASNRLRYLEIFKTHLDDCKAKGIEKLDDENPIYLLEYLYYRSYAHENLNLYRQNKTGDLKDIYQNLQMASKIVEDYKLDRRHSELMGIYGSYYWAAKDYAKAISIYTEMYEKNLQAGKDVTVANMLEYRGRVQLEAGMYKNAAFDFLAMASLRDSISQKTFYKELADMRAQRENDHLVMQNQEMELDAVRSRNALLLMGVGIIVLILICGLLIFLVYQKQKLSRQMKVAKEKAEEADRIKSAFLANMNHEIRTPLNAIVGFSQVLVDEEDKTVRQEFADIIQSNNELLQRLVGDVLDLSKIDSNTMSIIYKEQDIPSLMKEIYSMILLRMPAEVDLELADCEDLVLETDKNRLTQVLTNLLTNATKHTQRGFIRFGYHKMDSSVEFFVQDSGEGIPEDQLERVFSRFVQLDNWSKGVGLGLAICKGVVEQMGGSIRVTSKIGLGSIFYVTLPLIRPDINS